MAIGIGRYVVARRLLPYTRHDISPLSKGHSARSHSGHRVLEQAKILWSNVNLCVLSGSAREKCTSSSVMTWKMNFRPTVLVSGRPIVMLPFPIVNLCPGLGPSYSSAAGNQLASQAQAEDDVREAVDSV